jgi:TfoX/Sxy family transcriptional regulator of competence genes
VKPGCAQVLALEPEFLTPQDGHQKQDCESVAAKRWIGEVAEQLSPLGLTILGDDLYACTPMIQAVLDRELDYIFVAKESSHKYLYEEIHSLEKLGEVETLTRIQGSGKKRRQRTYRFVNETLLTADSSPVRVNWVEVVMTDEAGTVTFRTAFVTNHLITKENVEALVEAGRCRWKIENEDFNTLKTKGYHFEHNFGHGKQYLAQTLLSLNILAFLFHTVLELLDEKCAALRQMLPRRDTFFQHIAALTQYLPFADWQSLLEFMLRGLRDGPGPPPQSYPIKF